MNNIEEKIAKIQEEIRKTPYHKGTEHHIGLLKAKLAKLRSQLIQRSVKRGGSAGFAIPKQGDATCILVGLPSVGKSTILARLTSAKPKIAPYPFTTLSVIPGIMEYCGAKIQILDVPGIVVGAATGIGHGREVLSVVRIADLLVLVCEAENFEKQKAQVLRELEENGIRVGKTVPDIKIKKFGSGGLKVIATPDCGLDKNQIISISNELGLVNAQIQIKEKITQDDLIDAVLGNRVYLPIVQVASKIDLAPSFISDGIIAVSALKNFGIDKLKEKIWQELNLIRIYLKPAGGEPDFQSPLILKYGSKVLDAAGKISTDLAQNLKSAQLLRGKLKKQVGINFELENGDILTFLT